MMKVYNYIFNLAGYFCHQKPERSFFLGDYQFPFCARCTGIVFGFLISLILAQFIGFPFISGIFLLFIPMIIDGLMQRYTDYESNNLRRLITGFLFGFTYVYIFYMFGIIYL